MTPLLTVAELAVWARRVIAPNDPFALVVIEAASLVVGDCARHLDWLDIVAPAIAIVPAPARAKLIATQLAKRTYLNPDAVVGEGNIGPIGGDRYVEDFARTLELTEAETAELVDMRPNALPGNGLYVITVESGRPLMADPTIYLTDGQDPARASYIPMGVEGEFDLAYNPLLIT